MNFRTSDKPNQSKQLNPNQTGQKQVSRPTLPKDYLKDGYFDQSGSIKAEYILNFAEELARTLSSCRPELKKTQIRGFYDKVKYAWDALERDKSKLSDTLISIKELAPLAHQSATRGNAPQLFAEFIDKNVKTLKTYEEVKAFEKHFRAIICYYPESRR